MTSTRPFPLFHRPRSLALTVCVWLVLVMAAPGIAAAQEAREAAATDPPGVSLFSVSSGGISGNPGATNFLTGTGLLGRLLGFGKDSGVRLGGLWLGNANYLFAGGNDPETWSFNSLLLIDLSLDLEKLLRIPGAQFGVEFLQFNGQPTNDQAGVVAAYNSLTGPPPLVRSELYELWWRQRLFDDKLIIRIGKTVPTYDFNNVLRPLALTDESYFIPAVSGLIYTPIFINPTLIGAMPGYYNSAYGITATVAPVNNFYVSYGIYDGNVARGEQTGLNVTPEFNGYYFTIGEVGYAWQLGADKMPGTLAVGAWGQTGDLTVAGITENGAKGFYMFGSQRLWTRRPGIDNSGITGFFQFGINDSDTREPRVPFQRGHAPGVLPGARLGRHLRAANSDARAEPRTEPEPVSGHGHHAAGHRPVLTAAASGCSQCSAAKLITVSTSAIS